MKERIIFVAVTAIIAAAIVFSVARFFTAVSNGIIEAVIR
jgi:F0F1-type ATP synthase assembly protein I